MTQTTDDLSFVLTLVQELAKQLASELDLHYDDFPRDRFEAEMNALGQARQVLVQRALDVPDAVDHVLTKCVKKMS